VKRDLVEWANEAVSVFDVLESEFGIRHPRTGSSWKGYCPFGWEHPDGGVEKGFRTYPATNTAHCFVMHGQLTPVRIVSLANGWSYRKAASELLRRAGKLDRRPWRERWGEVQAERAAAETAVDIGDPAELVEAIHEALRTHPAYPPSGVSPVLSRAMNARLEAFEVLRSHGATIAQVREWFDRTKVALRAVLDEEERRERTG
jgi:hypothetical protein